MKTVYYYHMEYVLHNSSNLTIYEFNSTLNVYKKILVSLYISKKTSFLFFFFVFYVLI